MASDTARITVQFFGRDRTLGKSFRDQMKAADTFGKKMTLVGTRLKSIGRAMTMGVTMPVVAGFAAATKAAMDDERAQRALVLQIRNATKATDAEIASVERFIDVQARATGVADDELRPAFGKLVTATGDLTKAQKLLTIAQDTAAGTGRGLDSVITAMMKGTRGQVDLFGRMGIATKNAKGETKSFSEVLADLEDKFGGLAKVKADPFAKLKVAFGELAESLGTFLVPFVMRATSVLNKLATWLGNLSPKWRKLIVEVGLVAAAVGPLLLIFGQILITLPKIKAGLIALKAGFAMVSGPVGIVIAAVAALVAVFVVLYKKNETFRNAVNAVWGWLKKYVPMVVSAVIDRLRAWCGAMKTVASVAKSAFGKVKNAVQAVADFIGKVWRTIARCLNLAFAPLRTAISWAQTLFGWLGKVSERSASTRATGGRPAITTTAHHGGRGGQHGGIFSGPTSGYPVTMHGTEAIVPLARDRAADAARVLAAAGLIGGGNTVVNVYLDSEPIAARVEVRQAQRARRYAHTAGAPA